jgi:hypothetical protein
MKDMLLVMSDLGRGEFRGYPELPSDGIAGTVVEASTPLFALNDGDHALQAVSDAFDRSLEEIGLWLRAVRVTVGDPRIFPVGRLSVPPSVPFVVRFGENMDQRLEGLLVVNWGEALPSINVPDVEMDDAAKVMSRVILAKVRSPILAAEDAYARARRSFFVESDYAGTVVFANTAIEVFCNGLLNLLYWESGRSRDQIVEVLSNQGFET